MAVLLANALPISSWKIAIYRLLGTRVGRGVYIGPGVLIDPLYPELITLEDGSFLGIGCRLFAHEITAGNFRLGRTVIGAGSVVGAYATVRSGVSVGQKATIGFDSFVNRDVPDGATVVGVPARVIDTGQERE
jgi:acetyltransferase-like isoleucine patch superfamily enzyme